MNRPQVVWTVTSKELLDFVRDWRTLAAMLLVPLILFPIIFVAVPMFLQGEAEELGEYSVGVNLLIEEGYEIPTELMELLNSSSVIIETVEVNFDKNKSLSNHTIYRDEASLAIRNGELDAVMLLRTGQGNATENWEYVIFSDSTDELSREARSRLLNQIDIWEDLIIDSTLSENELEGTIPQEISNLTSLIELDLSKNNLSGELTNQIGALINLNKLFLDDNQLSGLIPEALCDLQINWSSNYYFNLSGNQFCPPYPDCFEDDEIGEQDTSGCVIVCNDETACNNGEDGLAKL